MGKLTTVTVTRDSYQEFKIFMKDLNEAIFDRLGLEEAITPRILFAKTTEYARKDQDNFLESLISWHVETTIASKTKVDNNKQES